MFMILILLLGVVYVSGVTMISYKLGLTKTENPKVAAIIGFVASFFPPIALIYLAVLLFKEEVSIV